MAIRPDDDGDGYASIRDPDLLGPFIGRRVVEITQQDEEEFLETRRSYVCLHFDNGATLTFPITADGFEVTTLEDGGDEGGSDGECEG